jgi:iron complex outermembrane receptor protein|tara:strand:+ start:5931 stop:8120 length:2190 start_codon:yes stop_codon:yes gene_type:complete
MKIIAKTILLTSVAFCTPAFAQSSESKTAQATTADDTPAAAQQEGLEDIVVTATRREERLQEIPVAVTALTSDAIESAGVQDVRSLTQVVPGFFGGKNIGLFLPVIRGVGSSSVSAADEANVATYIDGVYQPDPYSTFVDLAEVERVEVLRGPQGTVFGRNATGGLINVITPDPSFNLRGNIGGRYGRLRNDASDVDLKAYITGGLTNTLAADLSVVYRQTDDYITDLVRDGHLGGNQIFNSRSKLLWEPSETARLVLTAEYAEQDGSTNTTQPLNGNTAGRQFSGAVLPTEAWQSSVDTLPVLDFKRFNLALRTRFDLGPVNLETTTGYMHTRTVQVTDSDASNIFLGVVSADEPNINTESLSQEIRLLSTAPGPFQWLVGLYGFSLNSESGLRILSRPGGTGAPQTSTSLNPYLKTESYSGFGEGTYQFVPKLFLTLGVRYTWEKRAFEQVLNGNNLFGEANRSFDKVTYRGALRYEFADSANIYATYGTGYKSGVYNFTSTTPTPVDPETIDAYEIGLKVDPLSWLRMNISTYYYDYQNLQVVARAPSGNTFILQNAASAEIYGGEIEITAAVTRHLKLRASAAYTHSEYKDFPNAQGFVPLPSGGNSSVSEDASGNQLTRSPESSLNLGAVWTKDLANGTFAVAANAYHSSRVYFDFANRFSQEPYTLVSGELSYTTSDDNWRFTLWATNLTNQQVYREIRNGPLTTDVTYESPRRVGLGASYRF